ncbi:MAG: hypothetical protein PHT12_03790 [Patescibacteria group bacterium]|nr:hypothetical protein [Patescibacteria group bacterium]
MRAKYCLPLLVALTAIGASCSDGRLDECNAEPHGCRTVPTVPSAKTPVAPQDDDSADDSNDDDSGNEPASSDTTDR